MRHITNEMQDSLAIESLGRAASDVAAGLFRDQIVTVEVPTRHGTTLVKIDKHVRPDASIKLSVKMQTAFNSAGALTAINAQASTTPLRP